MAKSYTLIQAQTLTSAAATVTFSNIPQNFTDLVLEVSCRSVGVGNESLSVRVNGLTTGYTTKRLYGDGSSTASDSTSGISGNGGSAYLTAALPNANYTSNTFGAIKIILSNYTSSSNKSLTSIGVTENIATQSFLDLESGLLSTSSPITSITFLNYTGSNLAANSTFMLYGVGGTRATGGTITSDVDYTYHTFTSTSTFTALEKIKNAEILLVAGGGGGGSDNAGGGGAGGVVSAAGQTLFAGTSYTAVVGSGGAGGTSAGSGVTGTDSQFSAVTVAKGGGGGGGDTLHVGLTGGSGGGAGGGPYSGGTGTSGQGNSGGSGGGAGGGGVSTGGGGGGAGTYGDGGYSSFGGGQGGMGTNSYHYWHYATSTGVSVNGAYYIAGGGGGGNQAGGSVVAQGGSGGGGAGAVTATTTSPVAGTVNTGGGGGGGLSSSRAGAAGGSGLIIIRYPSV